LKDRCAKREENVSYATRRNRLTENEIIVSQSYLESHGDLAIAL
jgi:hypothetical protein